MATLTETTVEAAVIIKRDQAGTLVIEAEYRSKTDTGLVVRRGTADITDQMSQARLQGAGDLLADVVARVKTVWDIP